MQELKNHKLATDLTKQIPRRWKAGDVYAPHDLSSAEMQKWKKRGRPEIDAFDLLDMNPIEEYKVYIFSLAVQFRNCACFGVSGNANVNFWDRILL